MLINLIAPIVFARLLFQKNKKYAVLYFILMLNLIFWFVSAPDMRFGLAALLVLASLIVSEISQIRFSRHLHLLMRKSMVYIIICLFGWWGFKQNKNEVVNRLIFPHSMHHVETSVYHEGRFLFYTPKEKEDDRCFNEPIPCTPYPKNNLVMRSEFLSDGFMIK